MRRFQNRVASLFWTLGLAPSTFAHDPAHGGTPVPPSEAAQAAWKDGILLRIVGDVPQPVDLKAEDLAALTRQTVQAKDHSDTASTFEGWPVHEVLARAGVKFGKELRGDGLTTYLLVEAADGYRGVKAPTALP